MLYLEAIQTLSLLESSMPSVDGTFSDRLTNIPRMGYKFPAPSHRRWRLLTTESANTLHEMLRRSSLRGATF